MSNKNNNLDLSQYGQVGLDLVNTVASTAPASFKLKKYDSVDDAFNDDNFLRYLADKKDGLGKSREEIRSLYTGSEKEDTKHAAVFARIDNVVAASAAPAQ